MANDYEIWKCMTLIKMLIKRKQSPERAMEVYPKSIYERAVKQLKDLSQIKLDEYF